MKTIKNLGLVLGITISIFFVSFMVLAWVGPSAAPTGGNVTLPINVGDDPQAKTGSLTLNNLGVNGYVGIGKSPSQKLDVNGNVRADAFYYTSDIREKSNILPISSSLTGIMALEPISYNLKDNNYRSLGLSAQQVQEYFPEAVREDSSGSLSIDSVGLIALLVDSIKEQQSQINDLKNQIKLLKIEK